MPKPFIDAEILQAALVGLEHQKAEIDGKMAEIRRRLRGVQEDSPSTAASANLVRKRKPMSAGARNRIGAATRKRWAAFRKANGN
jgi:hypothetical protein